MSDIKKEKSDNISQNLIHIPDIEWKWDYKYRENKHDNVHDSSILSSFSHQFSQYKLYF